MSAEIIQFGRVRRDRSVSVGPETARASTHTYTPWETYQNDLRAAIADDDPAYGLFNSYKQAEAAYRKAMADIARRTGYNVRQVAKFMQYRRRAQEQA